MFAEECPQEAATITPVNRLKYRNYFTKNSNGGIIIFFSLLFNLP